MADITMCQNKKCNRRLDCYRFIAIPDKYYQSYFAPDENNCKHFLQATKSDKERYKRKEK